MKLFYATGSSAVPCLIVLEEAGIACDIVEVSFRRNVNTDALKSVNPLGKVGTLVLDDGRVLTQNLAILDYLASLAPTAALLPRDAWERATVLSWLALSVSDLAPLITIGYRRKRMVDDAAGQQQLLDHVKAGLERFLAHIDAALGENAFITGAQFTVADCHFAFTLPLVEDLGGPFDAYPRLAAYARRLAAQPSVQRAVAREGSTA